MMDGTLLVVCPAPSLSSVRWCPGPPGLAGPPGPAVGGPLRAVERSQGRLPSGSPVSSGLIALASPLSGAFDVFGGGHVHAYLLCRGLTAPSSAGSAVLFAVECGSGRCGEQSAGRCRARCADRQEGLHPQRRTGPVVCRTVMSRFTTERFGGGVEQFRWERLRRGRFAGPAEDRGVGGRGLGDHRCRGAPPGTLRNTSRGKFLAAQPERRELRVLPHFRRAHVAFVFTVVLGAVLTFSFTAVSVLSSAFIGITDSAASGREQRGPPCRSVLLVLSAQEVASGQGARSDRLLRPAGRMGRDTRQ